MKINIIKLICLFFVINLFFPSCKKWDNSTKTTLGDSGVTDLLNMHAPAGFLYKTVQQVSLNITILAPDNTPVKNLLVSILDAPASFGGKVLYKSLTDNNGKISGSFNLPTYMTQVVVNPAFPGIIQNAVVSVIGQTILCTLGGSKGYSGNVVPNSTFGQRPMSILASRTADGGQPPLAFMGTFDNQGTPTYMDPTRDVISGTLLTALNNTLPEGVDEPVVNPALFDTTKVNTINVTSQGDVWVTFVSKGGWYQSSFCYFTYPTGTSPASYLNIDSLHVIFPNSSPWGYGGGIQSGNKVNLGNFSAGTTIGFSLVANGWNGSTVGQGYGTYFSVDKINPESSASLKRHSLAFYNSADSNFIVTFEDGNRNNSNTDNDFNDVIFNITSFPHAAISSANMKTLNSETNSTVTYTNYYPSQNNFGSLVFEDNWPYLGDYDMNDVAVGYNYAFNNNSDNNTVSMNATFVIRASGAYYHDGFGVELPFASSNVQSVTGTQASGSNIVTFAGNGCESGQTNAVIIPFDDAMAAMNTNSGFNTYMSIPFLTPDTIRMTITFTTPITAATLGNAPFNPFIFINKTRGREAHLAGNPPTQKANQSLFGTGVDNSSPSNNRYYVTTSNLPWGLNFSQNIGYPTEGTAINNAYSKFVSWAQAGGVSNANWYMDSTNMVMTNIYLK